MADYRFWREILAAAFCAVAACRGAREDAPPDGGPRGQEGAAPDPTWRFEGGDLLLDPARVVVVVPPSWTPVELARHRALSVGFKHPSGALLQGVATRRPPGTGADATLRGILEDKEKQYGRVDGVLFADERVGAFPARTLTMTLHVAERAARMKVWALGNEAYWVNFVCGAPVEAFPAAEAECRSVVTTFHVAPR